MTSTAVVFDLDGTLTDSAKDICDAVNRTLKRFDADPLSLSEVTSFIGNGVPVLIERVLSARQSFALPHQAFLDSFSNDYSNAPVSQDILYPSARRVLEELHSAGYKLGICTNKPVKPTENVLNSLGLRDFFDAIVGGDTLPNRKPSPDMLLRCAKDLGQTQTVFVGDSEVDAETSVNAKIPFILHENGYRKSAISDLSHQASFSDFLELPKILETLHG